MDIMTSILKESKVQRWLVLGMVEGRSGTATRMKREEVRGNILVVRANRLAGAVGRASRGLAISASETIALASRLPDWDREVPDGISCFLGNKHLCWNPVTGGVFPVQTT